MKKVTVVFADDNPDMLAVIQEMLRSQYDIVATASDGESLVSAVIQHQPNVIITDISMPGLNGIEAAIKILELYPDSKIVLLTVNRDHTLVEQALAAGVMGYVLKLHAGEDLIPAINEALQGRGYVSSAIKYQGRILVDNPSDERDLLD